MWWPYLFACLLLISTVQSYKSGFYASSRYGKRAPLVGTQSQYPHTDGREQRSGIFWTGSRYNRRGLDLSGSKSIRKGSENFFMGSRYGKRNDVDESKPTNPGFDLDLCKYKYLYSCGSSR